MKCAQCGEGVLEQVTVDHPYDECGLPNVRLIGLPVQKCTACGTLRIRVPAIEALHRALAVVVLKKRSRLTGAEARFLRKYIGLSGVDFARRIGAEPETVSRWENDKQPMGPQTDRLLRLLVVNMGQVQEYPVEQLDEVDAEPVPESGTIRVARRSRAWAPIVESAAV